MSIGKIGAAASVFAAAGVLAAANNMPFWGQWGRGPTHNGNVPVAGQTGSNIQAQIVYDPFSSKDQSCPYAQDNLLVHYQTPLVDGNDVFMERTTGQDSNLEALTLQ